MGADEPEPPAGSPKQEMVRDRSGRFAPGHSGNPSGGPKALSEVIRLAREATVPAMLELRRLATKAKSEAVRVAACNTLIDRGWGKAPQHVTVEAEQPSGRVDLGKLTDEELHAYELLTAALRRIREEEHDK